MLERSHAKFSLAEVLWAAGSDVLAIAEATTVGTLNEAWKLSLEVRHSTNRTFTSTSVAASWLLAGIPFMPNGKTAVASWFASRQAAIPFQLKW